MRGEDVDGAAVLGVETGGVGEEGDAEVIVVAGGGFAEGGEVGGFKDVDAGEGLRVDGRRWAGVRQVETEYLGKKVEFLC